MLFLLKLIIVFSKIPVTVPFYFSAYLFLFFVLSAALLSSLQRGIIFLGLEYSTTESSDDVEKQEIDELSDVDEPSSYFDANEFLVDSSIDFNPIGNIVDVAVSENMKENKNDFSLYKLTKVERRKRLPTPIEKEKGVSLWSMIKDNVGKDLTRVCLPVYFNEPLSSLQKCFEDLEYSYLLDQAYEHGQKVSNFFIFLCNLHHNSHFLITNSILQILA